MNILISLSCAVAPAIFLIIYFYRQDKAKPEPKKVVRKVFIAGIISTIPAIILELLVDNLKFLFSWSAVAFNFFEAFIVAALCEELIKFFVVKLTVYKNTVFDETADGVVYTIAASLGFACLENVLYVMGGNLVVALVRAFTAVPLHAIASGIMGYYIGKAKFSGSREEENKLIRKGLLIAVLIHGYYDFVIFSIDTFGFIPALTIIPLLIIAFIKLRNLMKAAIAEDLEAGRVYIKQQENS